MYPLAMSVTVLRALQEVRSLWMEAPYMKQDKKIQMIIVRYSSTYVQASAILIIPKTLYLTVRLIAYL